MHETVFLLVNELRSPVVVLVLVRIFWEWKNMVAICRFSPLAQGRTSHRPWHRGMVAVLW